MLFIEYIAKKFVYSVVKERGKKRNQIRITEIVCALYDLICLKKNYDVALTQFSLTLYYNRRILLVDELYAFIFIRVLSRGKIESVFGHFTKFNIRRTDFSQNSV